MCLIPLARSCSPKHFLPLIFFRVCVSVLNERYCKGGFFERLSLCAIVMYTSSKHRRANESEHYATPVRLMRLVGRHVHTERVVGVGGVQAAKEGSSVVIVELIVSILGLLTPYATDEKRCGCQNPSQVSECQDSSEAEGHPPEI